jgi:hypothetical protein
LRSRICDRVYQVEAKREVGMSDGRREEHLETVPEEQHVARVAEVEHIPWPESEANETQAIENNVSEDERIQQVNDWYEHTTESSRQISKAINKRLSSPPLY